MSENNEHGWISYVAYKLRPEVLVLPEARRFQLAAFLVEILESPHDRVDVDCYCSVGFRSDCDFFVRYTAPTPDELQEICVKIDNSGLGRHLETTHCWMGRRRACPATSGEHPQGEGDKPPYFAVFPVSMKREWFALDSDERTQKMQAHLGVADGIEGVRSDTACALGLTDHDRISGFEVDDLSKFEAVMRKLRDTEVSAYVATDTPILLGRSVTAHEALELCGAL